MRNLRSRLVTAGLVLAVLLWLPAGAAWAQTSTTGTIRVIVSDADAAAIPGAAAAASTVESLTKRSGTTDSKGEVVLSALSPSTLYVVTVDKVGFNGARNENVIVTSGQTTTVRVQLQLSTVTEEVTVIGEPPLVDVTTAVTGQDLTLALTENLPIGRSYQAHLQLVPGVLPDYGSGNPASRSGMNYSLIGGDVGNSSDNFYYIEGINVTDPVSGTFGANMNTEIIQEQKVFTGGIPAEFVGAPGLLTSVITKSGGASYSGSANYFTEDDSLVADNENATDAKFTNENWALTLGGPIVWKDKLWFFGSYREVNREDDINSLDTNIFQRTVTSKDEQAFGKVTWAMTDNDRLQATFLNDPTERDGSLSRTVLNNRDTTLDRGGDRYAVDYTRVMGPAVVDLGVFDHKGELSTFSAVRDALNTVIFRRGDGATLADQQLGGNGSDLVSKRDTEGVKGNVEFAFDSPFGGHTLKAGADFQDHINFRDSNFVDDVQYRGSLANHFAGITAAQISAERAAGNLTASFFNVNNTSDFDGFLKSINASANRAAHYAFFDVNGDGVLTPAEVGARLVFNSTAGNPHGRINYDRSLQITAGSQETQTEGRSFYIQDTIRTGRLTVNVGVRAEEWTHVATTGEEIFTFDYEYAPRVSGAFDLRGDGRSKLGAFYGRYYDPIRMNLTNFAGTLSGRVLHEQVFANGEWITYRERGGPVTLDAFFAPTTKTPYTDEFMLTYQQDLGRNMSFEANAFHRETKDIIEDYDLCLYAGSCYPGDPNHPQSLFLGIDYFGNVPNANFFIATLAGGKRELDGFDLIFRKRLSNDWQALASYTWIDFKGNSYSDSNADFAGDVLEADPRAPNVFGRMPGMIEHNFKIAGSYHFDFGLVAGAAYRWNSGAYNNRTYLAFSRHLVVTVPQDESFEFAGINYPWNAPGAVGDLKNPSWGSLDLSARYARDLGPVGAEVFVSITNALDDQSAILTEDLSAGSGTIGFGEETDWVGPRAIGLGVRFFFGR